MRRRGGMDPRTVGLIGVVLVVIGGYFAWTKDNPLSSPYTVQAAFVEPAEVRPGNPVRIAGVDVGKVTGVEGGDDPRATVLTMEIDEDGLPIHEDATFQIRPRLFLEGNSFVDLRPGTPSGRDLEDGALVPATQTSTYVSIGDFLRVFESDTREDLRTVLDEYGTALADGGAAAFNRTTRYWARAYGNTARVNSAALGEREGDLSGYVRNAGRAAEGLARSTPRLRALVTNLAEAGEAFASEQLALSETIAELPRTLRQGYRTLGVVDEALPSVRSLARELTPAVRTSPETLDAAVPLARQLRGLVSEPELGGLTRELGEAVPPLARVTRNGVELQGEARQLASCQNQVLIPTSRETIQDERFPANGPVYEEAVKWFVGAAGGGRSFDANGGYSRTLAPTANFIYRANGRFLFNTQPLQGINPAPADMPPLRPEVPCETQEAPDLTSRPLPAPPLVRGLP